MGLGLGLGASTSGYVSWSPSSVSNLTLWLAVNKNITAEIEGESTRLSVGYNF